MSRKLNTTENAQDSTVPIPTASATPDTEYKVGPGRPPKEYQFKKGQSGNPKGAERKAPSLAPDLKQLLEQALDRRVTLTQGDKQRTLSLFAAGIEQLVKQYVKGDRHARNELFQRAEQVGLDLLGLHKNQGDAELTDDEIENLTDEQVEILHAAAMIEVEIRSKRTQPPSRGTRDRAA